MPNDYNIILADLQDRFAVIEGRVSAEEIELRLLKASPYAVCPRCSHAAERVHQVATRRVADTPIRGRKVTLVIYKRRLRCSHCGKVFTESFEEIAPRGRRTRRYEEAVYEQAKGTSLKDASRIWGITYTTLRRMWFRMAEAELAGRHEEYPSAMGIDEFSVARRHRYNTVMTDIEKRKVFDTAPGRDSEGVGKRLDRIPEGKRPWLFVSDLWTPYVKAIRKACPDAEIVADRFHVIRLLNLALDRVRRAEQSRLKEGNRNKLFRVKHILLKARERLDKDQRERLRSVLRAYPRPARAYGLKQAFRRIYERYTNKEDYDKACAALRAWCLLCSCIGKPA
ncbi:ISL3 family transposase [candidate division WOR-3 bacterium]|nr:ISL3 family transposase [candidate division WOR-3 bacterium]